MEGGWSEPIEVYRGVLDGGFTALRERATLIVTRRGAGSEGRVWLTLDGGMKTTFVMTDKQAGNLNRLLDEARRAR
jgi:hypothetical protein